MIEAADADSYRRKAEYHAARSRERARRIEELEAQLAEQTAPPAQTDRVPPIYGVTRYSVYVPDSDNWALSAGLSADEYREQLWAPERMKPREHVFLEWALPIYQRFNDECGYRHVVQYSPEMPARWVDALTEAAQRYPVLLLVPGSRWQDRAGAIKDDIARRGCGAGPAAWLRVDDDDLLAADLMQRLLPLVTEAHDGFCVSFGKGLTAEYNAGRLGRFGISTRQFVALGLTFIGRVDADGSVTFPPMASHARIHRAMPSIIDSRSVAYLRLLHDQQDRERAAEVVKNPTDEYHVENLESDLQRLFPSLAGSVDLPGESLTTLEDDPTLRQGDPVL